MHIRIIPICLGLYLVSADSSNLVDDEELLFFTAVSLMQLKIKCKVSNFFFFFLQIFRHGDRTPVDPYPRDPYRNRSYWPAAWGELTDVSIVFISILM